MSGIQKIPTVILGGTGYVAGELIRLLHAHPHFDLAAVVSDSKPGVAVADAFPHLSSVVGEQCFVSIESAQQLLCNAPDSLVLAAAPHGVSATLIDQLLIHTAQAGRYPKVVDISADYRFRDTDAYQAVYRHAHGAPQRLSDFICALPEHISALPSQHVAHPGCFATAMLLSIVPLISLKLIEPRVFVSGVTGSTGSGRTPTEGTHHPRRHSDLYSYGALQHRHAPEVVSIVKTVTGDAIECHFVPHSGPFARGIHATTQATLKKALNSNQITAALRDFYKGHPFVQVSNQAPHLKDVVSSNYAHLSATTDGQTVAVVSAIDNLTKGAAGGAVQWANRLFGFDQITGLSAPAPGWT
jgi:N-acetyl-gamma-glutamyl-phosphate reductase common form